MRIFLLFMLLASPLSAQEVLTFQWTPVTHPQFLEYVWALHSDGQPISAGRTQQTGVTVTVPSDVSASYHVSVSWVHRQNGKLTWHTSTATQIIKLPPPDTIVEPPDTVIVEPPPPDTIVEPPPPDTIAEPPAATHGRIGYLRAGNTTWQSLVWDSIHVEPGAIVQACAYFYAADDSLVEQQPPPPLCPEPPFDTTPPDPLPPDTGDPGDSEWLEVDFGEGVEGPWYSWHEAGVVHVADGELTVDLAADTEGYAGISITGIDLRNREVVAHLLETPGRPNTEAWLVIEDGNRRYYMGRASGSRTAAVVDAQGYAVLDSGGWRTDWDVAIRHEGNELLFQNIFHSDGRRGTRHRVPLDVDLSNVTISLMAGSQEAIRTSDVGTARWSGLTVRPAQ